MVTKCYVSILFVILLIGCTGSQGFLLSRRDISGNKIDLNGYYYKTKENGYYDAIFLYQNGVVLRGGNYKISDGLDSVERAFLSESFVKNNEYRKKVRYIWGRYHIEGDSITLERYVVPIFGERYQTYLEKGVILNKEQFLMTLRLYVKSGEIQTIQDTFNFRPLPLKPDSTNNFMEQK